MGQSRPRGLLPSRRHPGRNWQIDCDYAHQLSPAELEWLGRFYDESYHSVRWKEGVSLHSQQAQRALWRAYKANERDVLTRAAAVGLVQGGFGFEALGGDDYSSRTKGRQEQAAAIRSRYGAEHLDPGTIEDALLLAIDARKAAAKATPGRPQRRCLRPQVVAPVLRVI